MVDLRERAEVTVLLPRRTFRRLSQRLLHDRTADRIAAAVGRIPHVSATIVPFDTTLSPDAEDRFERAGRSRQPAGAGCRTAPGHHRPRTAGAALDASDADRLAELEAAGQHRGPGQGGPGRNGRRQVAGGPVFDETGGIRLLFFGRSDIPGIAPGAGIRATAVGEYKGHLALANPRYELVQVQG